MVENNYQQQIIDKLFPGPITLLLKKEACIPEVVTQNPYVGIRMPSNTVANEFLKAVKAPIAAPSANIS
ncbi:Sua5/YciO/YrdC/YwlC family protein [bacterium]|nr:Sua5/YciO/YrdC/YwlC family protein [bacterium]